jgi:hypothetical protein
MTKEVLTTEQKALNKAKKVKAEAKKPPKQPKQPKAPKETPEPQAEPDALPEAKPQIRVDDPKLNLLKSKLRRKFHQLSRDELKFNDKEALLTYVCKVLGYGKAQLDSIIVDL